MKPTAQEILVAYNRAQGQPDERARLARVFARILAEHSRNGRANTRYDYQALLGMSIAGIWVTLSYAYIAYRLLIALH